MKSFACGVRRNPKEILTSPSGTSTQWVPGDNLIKWDSKSLDLSISYKDQ